MRAMNLLYEKKYQFIIFKYTIHIIYERRIIVLQIVHYFYHIDRKKFLVLFQANYLQ